MKWTLINLKPRRINTWNTEINKKIISLLTIICGKIEDLLDIKGLIEIWKLKEMWWNFDLMCDDWCISFERIKEKLIQNKTDEEVVSLLNDVKLFFENNFLLTEKIKNIITYQDCISYIDENFPTWVDLSIFTLTNILFKCASVQECIIVLNKLKKGIELDNESINLILNKCSSFSECELFLNNYLENIELDIYSINIILAKCSSLFEYKKTVSKYLVWFELNWLSYAIKLPLLLSEKNLAIPKIKEEIYNVMKSLNTLELSSRKKYWIKTSILYTPNNYKNYIVSIIKNEKFENLNFIINENN
jgi:hypothetical protein